MELNKSAYLREELEQMSTASLETLLRAEAQKEKNMDAGLVRTVLRILETRQQELEEDPEVEAACQKFRGYYEKPKKAGKTSWMLKAASAGVIVGILLFTVPQAAQAESIFQVIARWTESVFAFFDPQDSQEQAYVFRTDHPGLQQVYDAVSALGVTDPVVPMRIPDGYELVECKTLSVGTESYVHARFQNGENELVFNVILYHEGITAEHYKDETEVEIVEYNGIDHYIMRNNEQIVVIWHKDNMECFLSADCQEDVLFEILESIYTTEDK